MKAQSTLIQLILGTTRLSAILTMIITLTASTLGSAATAATPKPTIVLVHGAFADASGWSKVILLLDRAGYPTLAVQNPLSSLPADIATTKRALESVKGPIVLVGHSYGGAVITGAATDNPNVKSLVYIAAYAPDSKELLGDLNSRFGTPPFRATLIPDSAGFLSVDRTKFHEYFADDVPRDEAFVMATTQKPLSAEAFGGSIENPAWKKIPSWYLVSAEDRVIPPELERFMAKRIEAKSIVELSSSHASFVSHPADVVKLIVAAAQ